MSHIKKYFEEPLIKIRRIIDRFEGPKVQIIFKVTIDFNINYDTAYIGNIRYSLPQNIVNLPLPFLVVITQLLYRIIFNNDCICILTGSTG